MPDAPKVFISHASEDKDRFVLRFGELLRSKGVDAWVDKWEILPGDSLIDKIFEEGLKDAKAVIIVLSSVSVSKPWVREELNAAMVRKINGLCRIIPVVIDSCQVPECLRSLIWERIASLENYDEALNRIVQSIFGVREKPPLGKSPRYAVQRSTALPSLKPQDAVVFEALCWMCIEKDNQRIQGNGLTQMQEALEMSEELFDESLHILKTESYAELRGIVGGQIWLAMPTVYGFHQYLFHTRADYNNIMKLVAALIVNEKKEVGQELAAEAKKRNPTLTELIVDYVVQSFEIRKWLYAARYQGPTPCSFKITIVYPQLTRWLREDSN